MTGRLSQFIFLFIAYLLQPG